MRRHGRGAAWVWIASTVAAASFLLVDGSSGAPSGRSSAVAQQEELTSGPPPDASPDEVVTDYAWTCHNHRPLMRARVHERLRGLVTGTGLQNAPPHRVRFESAEFDGVPLSPDALDRIDVAIERIGGVRTLWGTCVYRRDGKVYGHVQVSDGGFTVDILLMSATAVQITHTP